jgi:hypothetical protein
MALFLLNIIHGGGWKRMTRTRWMVVGAVMLGIAVAVYFVFFCPAECQ